MFHLQQSFQIFPKIWRSSQQTRLSNKLGVGCRSLSSYLCSIDQGTSSTRFIIFNRQGEIIGMNQKEHQQYFPSRGCVEHNPDQIWKNTLAVIHETLKQTKITKNEIASLGITNQRETTVVWNRYSLLPLSLSLLSVLFLTCPSDHLPVSHDVCRHTGKAYHNALVWNDTRTHDICDRLIEQGGKDRFRAVTGLPISPYFSATKLKYLLDLIHDLRRDAVNGDALFGTMDSYLIWKLTGGKGLPREHII